MTSELEQIDTDLQLHLLTGLKKKLVDYHTTATIAEVPRSSQLATITSSLEYLFVKLMVEAGVDKEFMLETLAGTYDRSLPRP
jgi:hypothetical protein